MQQALVGNENSFRCKPMHLCLEKVWRSIRSNYVWQRQSSVGYQIINYHCGLIYTKVKLLLNKNDKKLIFSDWEGSKKIKTYVSYSQWQNQLQRVWSDCLQKDLKDEEIDREKIEKFNLHGFMKPEMNYFVWWKGTKSNLLKKSRKVGMKERWSRSGRKKQFA